DRYTTAREMAEDLERYLRDEPVRARRPTLMQRLRKWGVRHQPVVWSGLLLLLVTLVGLTLSNLLLQSKQKEIQEQNKALFEKGEELVQERDAKTKAAAQAELINRFLVAFLSQAAPDENAREKEMKPEQLFRLAAQKITSDPKFSSDPEVEASLRLTLGVTFFKLGEFDEAESNLRRAMELRQATLHADHPDTLAAQEKLADFLNLARGKSDEAEPLSRQTYEARARIFGPSDPDTLDSMDTYATA